LKNKESRSATNGFTSISTKINAKAVVYTSTCVARNNGVNVTANKIAGDVSPAVSALRNALLLVAQKSRIGDWEGDTIIGKGHQGVITTHIDHKTKCTVLTKSNTKHANLVRQSIVQGLTSYRNQVRTITYDNGLEFSEHQNIAQTLSANIYFAHPYSSWERGLNESTKDSFDNTYQP
jgi:IS30 family transposase